MTKSEILNLVYNPAAAKANAWKVNSYRKETFLKALEIYHTVSHTAAREFLNGETMKNYPRSYSKYYREMKMELIEKLYSYMGRAFANIQTDMDCGFLTENVGRDGKDYYWYLDDNREAAIREEDGCIIDDTSVIGDLFC